MKITITERKSLALPFNLADAQNYVSPDISQASVIADLSQIFSNAENSSYREISDRFLAALYGSLEQPYALGQNNCSFLCYSATIALEVAASYLNRAKHPKCNVGLLHPTFDTLAYMTSRHGLKVEPITEDELFNPNCIDRLEKLDALILTLPNNPTGMFPNKTNFEYLADVCKKAKVTLIVDCCYRYYSNNGYDFYEIAERYGIEYIFVEDTGKLFPALDIKLGILNCSSNLYSDIETIHSDFLLEVSRFSLAVITQFFERQRKEEKVDYLRLIEANRAHLIDAVSEFGIRPVGGRNINVQLLSLPAHLDSTELQNALYAEGVGVVDGKRLYWADEPADGSKIRVALSRDAVYFKEAVSKLVSVLGRDR